MDSADWFGPRRSIKEIGADQQAAETWKQLLEVLKVAHKVWAYDLASKAMGGWDVDSTSVEPLTGGLQPGTLGVVLPDPGFQPHTYHVSAEMYDEIKKLHQKKKVARFSHQQLAGGLSAAKFREQLKKEIQNMPAEGSIGGVLQPYTKKDAAETFKSFVSSGGKKSWKNKWR